MLKPMPWPGIIWLGSVKAMRTGHLGRFGQWVGGLLVGRGTFKEATQIHMGYIY